MTTSVLNQIFKNKFQFPEKVVPPKNTVMDQVKIVRHPDGYGFNFIDIPKSEEPQVRRSEQPRPVRTPPPFTFSGNPPNVEVEAVSLFGGQVTITR